MNPNIPGFLFYNEWLDAIEQLETPEEQLELYKAITTYGIKGEVIEMSYGSVKASFRLLIGRIDTSKDNYMRKVEGGLYHGKAKTYNEDNIAELASQGLKAKAIADTLHISIETVYKSQAWKNR